MRSQDDLITINIHTSRMISFDLEQLVELPRFRTILDTLRSVFTNLTDLQLVNLSVRDYALEQSHNSDFPKNTPGTTGPGLIYDTKVEVVNAP
jgi:hypothetical protein